MDDEKPAPSDNVQTEPNRSTEWLAAQAFEKAEHVRALETMNTPTAYEDRKRAFVELALAREASARARYALDRRVSF